MFVCASIGFLYFLPIFIKLGAFADALQVTDLGAILACALLALSVVLYVAAPQKLLSLLALTLYSLLAALVGILIFGSGGVASAYLALWLLVVAFSAIFGIYGAIVPLVLASGYAVSLFVQSSSVPSQPLTIIAISTILPLLASYLIFHSKTKKQSKDDQTYDTLADELHAANSTSDVVINAIGDGVIAINTKGVIELMNPAASRIIGWGNGDALGLDYHSVLKLSDDKNQPLSEMVDPIALALANNTTQESKSFYVTTNGNKRLNLSLVASPIGQVGQGIIIVFRDITKEQAEEKQQAEFISTASHEMRTPVASIEGYLGLALNPATAQVDARAQEYITKAHESARHLGRLFQDLLDISKAEDGRLTNHPKVVDITQFVGDITEGLRPKAEEKGLRFFYKPEPHDDEQFSKVMNPILYANVDPDHLREVVSNLTENAIKYTLEGDVLIDVKSNDNHIVISIKDSGIGIPKEDISHLFQKFYRVDNSATREIGGTGLGLYLCRRLAEIMHGRIWVESEYGKGSTFYLEIPRIDRVEAQRLLDQAETEDASSSSIGPVAVPAPPTPSVPLTVPVQSQLVQPIAVQPASQPIVQPQPVAQPVPAPQPSTQPAAQVRDNAGLVVPQR